MTPWVRLWREMPNDPKFRAIAKKAGRSVSDVIAVFVTMMTAADEVGDIGSWSADDVAAGLDLDVSAVEAICGAMQGKVLDAKLLIGWQKRQPKRDDDSRDRVRAHREQKRAVAQCNAGVTRGNAPDTDTEEKKITNTTRVSAREGVQDFDLKGVGVGSQARREISPEVKRKACAALGLSDAEPLVAAYLDWPGSRKARDLDAHFLAAAPKILANMAAGLRKRIELPPPDTPTAAPVRPSSSLLQSLKGRVHAH